jgi:hypothetical protein
MTTVLIGGFIVLTGYLAVRLRAAHAENATLRAAITSLKRQLAKRRS